MAQTPAPNRKDVLPRELARSAPRPVSFSAAGKMLILALILFLLAGIGAGLWIYQEAASGAEYVKLLEVEGRTAEAVVTQIERKRGESNRHFLHYRFAAGGKEFTGRTRITKGSRARFSIGSTVPVSYLASNPQASWLQGREPKGVPLWLAPAALFCPLLCAAAAGWVLRRQRRLLSSGRAALARVLSTEKLKGRDEAVWRVRYEWQLLKGTMHRGKYEAKKNPPAPGALIPIVYDREEPRRNARYPLPLVRITRT
jgi:hypothetical protein